MEIYIKYALFLFVCFFVASLFHILASIYVVRKIRASIAEGEQLEKPIVTPCSAIGKLMPTNTMTSSSVTTKEAQGLKTSQQEVINHRQAFAKMSSLVLSKTKLYSILLSVMFK